MKFENKDTFELHNVFGMGEPNTAYARYFIGDSFLNPLTDHSADYLPQMLLLHRGVVITGIYIMPKEGEGNCLFAQLEKGGIRKKVRMRSVCVKAALY